MLKNTHLQKNLHSQSSASRLQWVLAALLLAAVPQLVNADNQVFIQSIGGSSALRVTDIDTLYLPEGAVADIPGRVDINTDPAFDDGDHMVIDPSGQRIFVSDHNSDFAVYDFALNLLSPTWGISLSEPLGLAVMPGGDILITDEADTGGSGREGLFRLTPGLSLNATATGTSSNLYVGLEGVIYDAVHNRIYAADEDDDQIEIFNGSSLAHIGNAAASSTSDGPYWLAVDGSSNHLFVLYDSRSTQSQNYGIHVFDISSGGDSLTFNQTLVGSSGGGTDCVGSIAVSESRDRLFAVDQCSDTVNVYDTVSLTALAPVPSSRSGNNPKMVAVGHLREPAQVPLLSGWAALLLAAALALAGMFGMRKLRA